MLNCQNFAFSDEFAQNRMNQFKPILGMDFIRRIFCLTFFLLGVDRKSIAKKTKIPEGSIRSFIRALSTKGLPAFEDHRRRTSSFLPPKQPEAFKPVLVLTERKVEIQIGPAQIIQIPRQNELQMKVVLLTLMQNGLLASKAISKVLDLSVAHTLNLSKGLEQEDVSSLMDHRKGSLKDYKFTPEIKGALIAQFVLDTVTSEGKTSGAKIAEHLKQRSQLDLSDRSIRSHMEKLGLSKLKKELPALLASLKKTQDSNSQSGRSKKSKR